MSLDYDPIDLYDPAVGLELIQAPAPPRPYLCS